MQQLVSIYLSITLKQPYPVSSNCKLDDAFCFIVLQLTHLLPINLPEVNAVRRKILTWHIGFSVAEAWDDSSLDMVDIEQSVAPLFHSLFLFLYLLLFPLLIPSLTFYFTVFLLFFISPFSFFLFLYSSFSAFLFSFFFLNYFTCFSLSFLKFFFIDFFLFFCSERTLCPYSREYNEALVWYLHLVECHDSDQ